MASKPILDPCCGSKMFYFQPHCDYVDFCDVRRETLELCDGRILKVEPDTIADVTDLPFADGSKALVIFDPPHLNSGNGWKVQKYGKLPSDWKSWMTKAFSECWRVLANNGTLVFKWYEYRISLASLRECFPAPPLFGNRKPKGSKTHWLVFFKPERNTND